MTGKRTDDESPGGDHYGTTSNAVNAVGTHLLKVCQRRLIVSTLLEVILGCFDNPFDDLGVDGTLYEVQQPCHEAEHHSIADVNASQGTPLTTAVFDISKR